ncbi:serine/threonine protein kinase [Patescibacteria group bacterium]|nr:serine/threonine protein kinase [Patescibacteria group bacterium]
MTRGDNQRFGLGTQIDISDFRVTLKRQIGIGASSIVFEGEDESIQRPIAIKTSFFNSVKDPEYQAFVDEVENLGLIGNHPHILAYYGHACVTREEDTPLSGWIALEYARGDTVARLIESTRSSDRLLPLLTALSIAKGVALAISYLERKGLVHADIKPENCFLCCTPTELENYNAGQVKAGIKTEHIKLGDFGITSLPEIYHKRYIEDKRLHGTPLYIAPEQILGNIVPGKTDLYSLGVMLYQMVTGGFPKEIHEIIGRTYESSKDQFSTMMVHRLLEPTLTLPPNVVHQKNYAFLLNDLIIRLTAKDPADRPSPAEVINNLSVIQVGLSKSNLSETQRFSSRTSRIVTRETTDQPTEDLCQGKKEKREPLYFPETSVYPKNIEIVPSSPPPKHLPEMSGSSLTEVMKNLSESSSSSTPRKFPDDKTAEIPNPIPTRKEEDFQGNSFRLSSLPDTEMRKNDGRIEVLQVVDLASEDDKTPEQALQKEIEELRKADVTIQEKISRGKALSDTEAYIVSCIYGEAGLINKPLPAFEQPAVSIALDPFGSVGHVAPYQTPTPVPKKVRPPPPKTTIDPFPLGAFGELANENETRTGDFISGDTDPDKWESSQRRKKTFFKFLFFFLGVGSVLGALLVIPQYVLSECFCWHWTSYCLIKNKNGITLKKFPRAEMLILKKRWVWEKYKAASFAVSPDGYVLTSSLDLKQISLIKLLKTGQLDSSNVKTYQSKYGRFYTSLVLWHSDSKSFLAAGFYNNRRKFLLALGKVDLKKKSIIHLASLTRLRRGEFPCRARQHQDKISISFCNNTAKGIALPHRELSCHFKPNNKIVCRKSSSLVISESFDNSGIPALRKKAGHLQRFYPLKHSQFMSQQGNFIASISSQPKTKEEVLTLWKIKPATICQILCSK